MKVIILSKTDKELYGADIMVKYDYTDVAAATTGVAVNAFPVLAGTKAQCVGSVLDTPFDNPGTGALTVSSGDTGGANSLLPATVVALDGAEVLYAIGGAAKAYQADDFVKLTFIDATSMAYTVGAGRIFYSIQDMNKWAKA